MKIGYKLRFYIMSLWLLAIFIFILTVDVSVLSTSNTPMENLTSLLQHNVLPFIMVFFIILCFGLVKFTQYQWKGASNPAYSLISVKNENYEYLTFLTTCIIPLICIDFHNMRYLIVLGILLAAMGVIFIKMDLYYGNPTLALMGYRLYRAKIMKDGKEIEVILISKEQLYEKQSVRWIAIDEFVWLAKRGECE